VVDLVRGCEDKERILVIYKQLYAKEEFPVGTRWARGLEDFVGFKEIDGKKIKRFALVK
jgi:hypothetical protein